MLGLRSQFDEQLMWLALVFFSSAVLAVAVGLHAHRQGRSSLLPITRALTCGAALVVVVATILPVRFPASPRGDLALGLGHGGLGDWRVLLTDTDSLASILLILNTALYIPVAFFGTLGWPGRIVWVALGCLALSLTVETAQYLALDRVATTDDVLLNSMGVALGAIVGKLASGWRTRWHTRSAPAATRPVA